MALLSIIFALAAVRADIVADGIMLRYGPGVMERAVERQVLNGNVRAGIDPYWAVALTDCSRIGQRVWLEWPDGELTGPHPVVDCSDPVDLARHLRVGLAVEVSYELARDRSIPNGRYRLPLDGPLIGVRVWSAWPAWTPPSAK